MRLLTSFLAASLLALGACSSVEQRDEASAGNSTTPGTTCLPPGCPYSTVRAQTKSATSAKPTVRPRH